MFALKDVAVKLSGIPILRGLSLDVPTGRVIGLVGRNGAGKTTTLRSIMGLVPLTGGTIRLDGTELAPLPPHERARLGIGYLPEDRRLIDSLTVEENLLVPAQAVGRGDARAGIEAIYEMLPEVRETAGRRAAVLSGGQQKFVALARSFVNGTRLLLLDEPFEGVSTALSRRLAQVVHDFRDRNEGLSVLVAESDLKRAAMLTDMAYIIERGEIVDLAPIERVRL